MKFAKALLVAACLSVSSAALAQAPAGAPAGPPPAPPLLLSTTAFTDGGVIPDKFSQVNPNAVSPALTWDQVPAGTQSFTLIVHDPDVSLNKTTEDVLHWLIFNIPGTAKGLPEGVVAAPQGADGAVQIKNRANRVGYMGMGARGVFHHYTFELYALDTKLTLTSDATRADVLKAMDGHVIGKAAIEGRFHR